MYQWGSFKCIVSEYIERPTKEKALPDWCTVGTTCFDYGADYCYAVDDAFYCNAKKEFHICDKCLKDLKADLSFNRKMEREREMERDVVDGK